MEKYGRPKTKEELQAQIEGFAEKKMAPKYTEEEEHLRQLIKEGKILINFDEKNATLDSLGEKTQKSDSERKEIFENSSELSKLNQLKNFTELDKLPEGTTPEQKEILLKYKDRYLEYLKENNIKNREFQAECIKRYEQEFEPIVKNIISQLEEGKNPKDIDGYMKPGTFANVFKFENTSGKYVAKRYLGNAISMADLEAMRIAKDVPNVSHLVAYSQKDKILVMDFIEGKDLSEITKEEKPSLADEEIESIFKIILDLYDKGIEIDPYHKNFIFGKEKGFSVIDYHILEKPKSFIKTLRMLPEILSRRKDTTYEKEDSEKKIDLALRMIKVLEEKFPEFCNQNKEEFEKWKRSA